MENGNENNFMSGQAGDFGLPGDYFQRSAGSIINKIEWQEEHKDLFHLMKLRSESGFVIPGNYFENNSHNLELVQFPFLKTINKENVFKVPGKYFEELEVSELEKVISLSYDDHKFSKLNSFKKGNSFKVPGNYFEKTEKIITGRLKAREAKVISLVPGKIGFAVAAMLLLVMGLWLYNFYFIPAGVEDCGTIACLDKQDLVKTKSLENLDEDQLYELVDPSALEKKLGKETESDQTKNKKDSSLNGIPDEDLLDEI